MAEIHQSSQGATFSSLLAPFTSVATATVRPLKGISALELATLREGDMVYTTNLRDYWKWLPASSLTDDSATGVTICAPTIVGAGLGRFERLFICSPDWMLQATWVIDGQNTTAVASNENTGSAAAPLLTDIERQRRMGPLPTWSLTEYHIRYISDLDYVFLAGNAENSDVFVHGSLTDGLGKTVLYTGVIDALTAEAPATNVPYQITSNAIPVSWTASGLISATFTNARVRVTSNTVGAIGYAVFDQTAKKARWTEVMGAVTFTAPYNSFNFTSPALVNASTFVVESLTQIKYFQSAIQARGKSGAGTYGTLIVESLALGMRDGSLGVASIGGGNDYDFFNFDSSLVFQGCIICNPSQGIGTPKITVRACWITSQFVSSNIILPHPGNITLVGGGTDQIVNWAGSKSSLVSTTTAHIRNNFMFQNGVLSIQDGICNIISMAVFDPPAANQRGLHITGRGMAVFNNAALHWGGGTVRPPTSTWFLTNPCRIVYTNLTNIKLLGSTVDIQFDTRGTTIPAFDQTTGLFTAPRTTSFANLIATVAAGGFGGTILDPASGSFVGTA